MRSAALAGFCSVSRILPEPDVESLGTAVGAEGEDCPSVLNQRYVA
jgi:hypothetical protein